MGNAEYMGLASNAAPAPEHPDPDSSYASPGSGNSEWTLGAPAAVASALRGGLRSGSGYYCGGTWNGNNNDGSNYEGPLANTGIDQCKSMCSECFCPALPSRPQRSGEGQQRPAAVQNACRADSARAPRSSKFGHHAEISHKKKKKKKKKKVPGFLPQF